jgi:hypothetical protein
MTWTLDRSKPDLVHSEGRTEFSRAEWAQQVWPSCPVCGGPISVQGIPTPALDGSEGVLLGRWSLPCNHDPRER